MSKLSIIIPVFFNEDTLMDCYFDIRDKIIPKIEEYEVILVDDGSEDDSYLICKEIALMDNNVKVIKLSRNFGSHAACLAGLYASTGNCATIKAADMQEPSSLILDMFASYKMGNKVVLAVRANREDKSLFSSVYYNAIKRHVNDKMPKGGFDCYLLDKKVIEALKLLDERNSAITLQILWSGFQTGTVFYDRLDRAKGKSKWTLAKKIKLVIDSFVSFSSFPIKVVGFIGALFAAGAGVWAIALISFSFAGIINVEGWVSLMVLMLFSFGLIMIILGILGEYMWRILDVSQNRPVYFIEEEFKNDY